MSLQEVAGKVGPHRGQYRLGVELDAVDAELAVADGHHLALVARRRDVELLGDRRRGERVVAAGDEVVGEATEEPESVVVDHAGLPVDERLRRPDLAAEDFDDRLVAEADAQRRDPRGEPPDDLAGRAGIGGPAWTGGDDEVGGLEPLGLVRFDRVVPADVDLGAELPEQVSEVVGERVVVVDQQNHDRASPPSPASAPAGRSPAPPPPDAADGAVPFGPVPPAAPEEAERASASSRARSSAASLRRHSSCSALGEESATIPAPA